MIDLEDFLLYGLGAGFAAGLSKGLEILKKPKAAKVVDVIFYAGSAALLIRQVDALAKEVSNLVGGL